MTKLEVILKGIQDFKESQKLEISKPCQFDNSWENESNGSECQHTKISRTIHELEFSAYQLGYRMAPLDETRVNNER